MGAATIQPPVLVPEKVLKTDFQEARKKNEKKLASTTDSGIAVI